MFKMHRCTQTILVFLLLGMLILADFKGSSQMIISVAPVVDKDRLVLWYTDEGMSDYFNTLALQYKDETGIRLVPCLKSGIDYIEEITSADEIPDVIMMSHSMLQEADMMLIAEEIPGEELAGRYCDTAISACRSSGKTIAYPLCYDTVALVVNKSYLATYAKDQLESAWAQEEADKAANEGREPREVASATEREIGKRVEEYIPNTFVDLMDMAENYDANENVKAVLGWDNSDVFYNYFILGDTIELAGADGDEDGRLSLVNGNSCEAMNRYKELTDFFSLDEEGVNYESIRDGFCRGEFVYSIVSTDILKMLKDAKSRGDFEWEYEIYPLPLVNDDIISKPLSMTQTLCVNQRGDNKEKAQAFAEYASDPERAQLLFEKAGRLMPAADATEVCEGAEVMLGEYLRSTPSPKLVTLSDFWMQLEIAFLKVQDGDEPEIVLLDLENSLK